MLVGDHTGNMLGSWLQDNYIRIWLIKLSKCEQNRA